MAANRAGRTGDNEDTTRGTEAAGTSEATGAGGAEAGGEAGAGGGTETPGRRRGGRAAAKGTRATRGGRGGRGAAGGGEAGGGGDAGEAAGGGRGRTTRARGGAAGGRGGGRAGGRAGGRTAGRGGRTARSEQPDLRTELRDWAAARSQGWGHHDWENLLGELQQRGHDVSDRAAVGRQLEQEKLALRLESVQGMGRARVQSLVDRFGTLYSLQQASADQLAEVPNITRSLAERIKQEVG